MSPYHRILRFFLLTLLLAPFSIHSQSMGSPGDFGVYIAAETQQATDSGVSRLEVFWGEKRADSQWLKLSIFTTAGRELRLWFELETYPSPDLKEAQRQVRRYLMREQGEEAIEYRHGGTGRAALPQHGYWPHQLPRSFSTEERTYVFPRQISFLGHPMNLHSVGISPLIKIPTTKILDLPSHLEIGARYDTRDDRQARRFDNRPIKTVKYEAKDYPERLAAGQTTFNVPSHHVDLVRTENVYYLGDNPNTVDFPECLYRSNYLGPNPDYLDEPGVRTSFSLQDELKENPSLAKDLTVEFVLERFKDEFERSSKRGRPTRFQNALANRTDVDLGTMDALQRNVWSWEVHLSTGAYQLRTQANEPPSAIVYEGRSASNRDLPLFNSSTGAQIPTHDQQAWLDMIYGMMRGAARLTGKEWGIAIYGQFQVPEIYRALTYAYDLGASYFLFWTSDRGHHVPYEEQLHYSNFIRTYARQHPGRELEKLKTAAEVLILFPPGYLLLTKEPMWWLPPLNYEKKNRFGLRYREVLSRIAAEIERCYRLGVAYDLAWDLEGLNTDGYREIVRIQEDGQIEVKNDHQPGFYNEPRWPDRPSGTAPGLEISLSNDRGKAPMFLVASAAVTEFQSPIHFSPKHDDTGVWSNTKVIWQLYGPDLQHYQHLSHRFDPESSLLPLELEEPGTYRLRASVVDRAGRSTVKWKTIRVE